MTRNWKFSQQVQSFLDSLDGEDNYNSSPEEGEEMRNTRATVRFIVDDVIASRETLTDNKMAAIEKLVAQMPDVISHILDDRYTRDVIDAVPGYVRRTMELSRIEGSQIRSKVTNGYLSVAVHF